jgi:hypothetical protein
MNYLKKNLHNSKLPYDIMRLIYEYADPLLAVIKQIENAEYDLDELMYQKMKKMILKHFTLDSYISFHEGLHNDYYGNEIVIDIHNMDNSIFKDVILNYSNGYKQLFLYKHKIKPLICGLKKGDDDTYRHQILSDLQYNTQPVKKTKYKRYSTKQLYKKWIKL